ncbi:MAG: TVP38/TMEM64 family protein [Phycisphaeraceae bacterium]|nr:TVP38/TMEM64 family protein [Phycisphaeraceae bacterium]
MLVKGILAICVIAALVAAANTFDLQQLFRQALAWISGLGVVGPLVFIGLYIVACVLLLPGSLLTLGAGAVFGVLKGSWVVSVASTLGATCAFLVGRYLARDWVGDKIAAHDKFKAIDEAVAAQGWKIVGLTRLSPVFPFNLLNYAFGLTQVKLKHYVVASWLGMLPGTIMYVYIGSLAGDLATLGSGERTRTPGEWALYAVGLVATVAVTVFVTRIAKKALNTRIAS